MTNLQSNAIVTALLSIAAGIRGDTPLSFMLGIFALVLNVLTFMKGDSQKTSSKESANIGGSGIAE